MGLSLGCELNDRRLSLRERASFRGAKGDNHFSNSQFKNLASTRNTGERGAMRWPLHGIASAGVVERVSFDFKGVVEVGVESAQAEPRTGQ